MTSNEFIPPPCNEEIEILYEDEHVLVINKPSCLLSLSGKKFQERDSVYQRILENYPNARMVHRLDFGTSGLMLVALDKKVCADLAKQFQYRTIEKSYVAKLYGHFVGDIGVIKAPIAREEFPKQKICLDSGKSAQTNFEVISRDDGEYKTTTMAYSPKTGRTHQLRIHSNYIGHPILGCDLYNAKIDGVDTKFLSSRLLLHASKITFKHPINSNLVSIESSVPF